MLILFFLSDLVVPALWVWMSGLVAEVSFFFRHGTGLQEVGKEGGEVKGKSRAEDDMERGKSNVREKERDNVGNGRAGTSGGPVVVGWWCSCARGVSVVVQGKGGEWSKMFVKKGRSVVSPVRCHFRLSTTTLVDLRVVEHKLGSF